MGMTGHPGRPSLRTARAARARAPKSKAPVSSHRRLRAAQSSLDPSCPRIISNLTKNTSTIALSPDH